tara:strand:- start:136 stop:981 length:846 start_codon:yes stop_codon:yes gene_type:complete
MKHNFLKVIKKYFMKKLQVHYKVFFDGQKYNFINESFNSKKSNKNFEIIKDHNKAGAYFDIFSHSKFNLLRIIKSGDIIKDLCLISNLIVRGNKDDNKGYEELKKIIKTRKLILTCGYLVGFLRNVLKEFYSINSRIIHFVTKHELNNIIDSHTIIEINIAGKWILLDPSLKYKIYKKGEYINSFDLIDNISAVDFVSFGEIITDPLFKNFKSNNFSRIDEIYLSRNNYENFKERIFYSLILEDKGEKYHLKDDNQNIQLIYGNKLKSLDRKNFYSKFYLK